MMKSPFVSVVMPVFNEEKYVGNAIESILKQTYTDFELIIVDDYSNDQTVNICKSFMDSRIRFYQKTVEPKYPATSRNIGIQLARGQYVVFQDADDYSHPTRIEKQLCKALENPGKRIVGCSIFRIEGGVERKVILPESHNEIIKGFKRLYNRDTIVGGLILAPKEIMDKIIFKTQLRYFEDWDQLLRLFETREVEFWNCQEPLYTYYIRQKGVLFQSNWIDDNLYVRHCQNRRKLGLKELDSVDSLDKFFNMHPFEKAKWSALRKMILFKRYMYLRKISNNLRRIRTKL